MNLIIKKFNTSHKLEFQGFDLVVLDKNLSGYAIIFSVLEGVGLEKWILIIMLLNSIY